MNKIVKYISILAVAIACINMGGAEEESSTPKLYYTELEKNQKSFSATVHDTGKSSKVRDINFGGKSKIEGVRQEGRPGHEKDIDFSTTKELIVVKPRHFTPSGQEFTLVKYVGNDGGEIDNLLFPKNLVLSAKGVGNGENAGEKNMDLYWEMHKIVRVEIHNQIIGE